MDEVTIGELERNTFGVEDGFDMLIVSQAVVRNRGTEMCGSRSDDARMVPMYGYCRVQYRSAAGASFDYHRADIPLAPRPSTCLHLLLSRPRSPATENQNINDLLQRTQPAPSNEPTSNLFFVHVLILITVRARLRVKIVKISIRRTSVATAASISIIITTETNLTSRVGSISLAPQPNISSHDTEMLKNVTTM